MDATAHPCVSHTRTPGLQTHPFPQEAAPQPPATPIPITSFSAQAGYGKGTQPAGVPAFRAPLSLSPHPLLRPFCMGRARSS